MNKQYHILLPSDFSTCASKATAYAVWLARKQGGKLSLLHVSKIFEEDPISSDKLASIGSFTEPEPHVRRQMEEQLAGVDLSGVDVALVQTNGLSVSDAVAEYAYIHGVDLVAMGTHGRKGFKRWLLGSVAEELVRWAPCPVLSIKEAWTETPDQIEKILVPIDFSYSSRAALRGARAFAAKLGVSLQILHVVETPPYPEIYAYASANDFFEEARAKSLDVIHEMLAEEGPTCPTEIRVVNGHPTREILEFAEKQGSQLIMMAHLGLTGLADRVLGSVTEHVVRNARCPVLTADLSQ